MEKLKKIKKIMAVVSSMLLIVVVFKFTSTDITSGEMEIEIDVEAALPKSIKVHISGEVVKEGVYELEEGQRIEDLIELAGGLTENANCELVNFAEVLTDGEKITIMKKRIVAENNESSDEIDTIATYDNPDYTIIEKINYMTAEEFQVVPGIGEKISEDIIFYREKIGQFSDVNELKEVSGIGDGKLKKIIEFLS